MSRTCESSNSQVSGLQGEGRGGGSCDEIRIKRLKQAQLINAPGSPIQNRAIANAHNIFCPICKPLNSLLDPGEDVLQAGSSSVTSEQPLQCTWCEAPHSSVLNTLSTAPLETKIYLKIRQPNKCQSNATPPSDTLVFMARVLVSHAA
jgi:hypothetical protein